MRYYGHNKGELMATGKPQAVSFPSGKGHVILPNGQHVNPSRGKRESKKDRLKA